jgi:hypothetical protein
MKLLRTLQLGKGLGRRQLLKTLGLSAAAAPLMPRLGGWSQAHAAGATPRRLVLLFSSSGVIPEQWNPTGTETNFAFPTGGILEPMAKHKGDMIFLKGLQRGAGGGGGHEQSMGGLWTGNITASSVAQAASVDQIIAKLLPKETDFQSYPFGAMCFYAGEGDITSKIKNQNPYMIHAGPAQKIPSECDPYKTYDRMFAGQGTGGVGDTMAMDQIRAEKTSILDLVTNELNDVQAKVSKEDRMKITSHLDSVRDIERRLQSGGAKTMGAVPRPDGGIALDKTANYPKIIDIQNKLLVAALAADKTRVASLQYSRGFSQIVHSWVGAKTAHHTLSHLTSEKTVLAGIQRWYAGQFASLIDQLKAVPENGQTLFDNTLLVYSNELALGWEHSVAPAATWWATGAAGKFGGMLKGTGRFLDGIGDYNQMLVTMAHAMGVTSVNRIGSFATKDGPLPGILA